jgi:hypothetical protein
VALFCGGLAKRCGGGEAELPSVCFGSKAAISDKPCVP